MLFRSLFETESSFTNFQRWVGSDGRRLDLHPRVFLPLSAGGYFTLTPFVGGRGTFYDIRVVDGRLTRDGGIQVEVTRDDPFVRALAEWGSDLEARAVRIFDVGGVGGISTLQHLIEPRANITEIRGVNKRQTPQWDPGGGLVNPLGAPLADVGIDRIGTISRLTYSLTNRLNAKTVAGVGEQAVKWELMRFSLGQTYDLTRDEGFEPLGVPPRKPSKRFGDLAGEVILQPNSLFRFRGDARYDVYGDGLQNVNGDISATLWDVTALAGGRFDDRAKIEFIKGEILAKISRYLDLRGSTQYDISSGTALETRVGMDIHCQCATISLGYIRREGVGLARNENAFHISVSLLGVGQVGSSTSFTPTTSGSSK